MITQNFFKIIIVNQHVTRGLMEIPQIIPVKIANLNVNPALGLYIQIAHHVRLEVDISMIQIKLHVFKFVAMAILRIQALEIVFPVLIIVPPVEVLLVTVCNKIKIFF